MAMPTHHPWRSLAPILVLLLLFSTALAQRSAQEPPRLQMESSSHEVGDSAVVLGSGLDAEEQYTLEVTDSTGDQDALEVRSDADGSLSQEIDLPTAGTWTVELRGGGLSGSLALVVEPSEADEDGDEGPASDGPEEQDAEAEAQGQPQDEGASFEVDTTEPDASPDEELPAEDARAEADTSQGEEDESEAVDSETVESDTAESAQGEDVPGDADQPENDQAATQRAADQQPSDERAGEQQDDDSQDAGSQDASAQSDEPQDEGAQPDEPQTDAPQTEGDQPRGAGEADEPPAEEQQDENGQADEQQDDAQDEDAAAQPTPPDDQDPTEVEREISVEDGAVVAREGEEESWRFGFTPESGGIGAMLVSEDVVWVGVGNSLLQLDPDNGTAQSRYAMPGRVIRLERMGTGVSVVSDLGGGLRQRIEVGEQGPRSTVRFGTQPEQFEWLRNEAAVEDPVERLQQDPTNPWLHLRVALAEDDAQERQEGIAQALERAQTFYDLAGIARQLQLADESEAAEEAMGLALTDFADRSYDPRLLDDPALHRAYDFPLAPMERALDQADLAAADFWAPWLYLVSSSDAEESREALSEYARQLDRVGQTSSASLWRERAREGGASSPTSSLERFFLRLGSIGWYGVAALLAAILALHLTLVAKYWAPQSLAMRRRVETGGPRRPWMRIFAIRFYSFTEKVVLVLLFATCLALLGLASWYDSSADRPAALGSGTLASPVARDLVTSLPLEGERAAFIRGYAAHAANETSVAEEEYELAGDYPPALNNLAALSGEEALYRRALELAPALPEAAYNLDRRTNPSPFHEVYGQDEPLLAVPDEADFRTAASGSWQRAIGATFENPWSALRGLAPMGIPALAWQILLALFLLWITVTVLWLLLPRPAYARNAPRNPAYHVLALLIPGSGLADEAWGVLLMVPWALLGVDALSQWFGWERSLGLPLQTELWALAVIYLVNLIAFVVEFSSYQKRMRELRRNRPEAAEAYALRRA